ncbi:hypothetical protein GCM10007907_27560 [Chitinimonas prasina]|uniref:Secreted protein n=1 Tax=Chitinimonas prasina TaxID=1434937 RepID=A0ABQ5YL37_9NEIS|nr:hypothetical protein GCM10007907_27560 [Chitinimonas prasina]
MWLRADMDISVLMGAYLGLACQLHARPCKGKALAEGVGRCRVHLPENRTARLARVLVCRQGVAGDTQLRLHGV